MQIKTKKITDVLKSELVMYKQQKKFSKRTGIKNANILINRLLVDVSTIIFINFSHTKNKFVYGKSFVANGNTLAYPKGKNKLIKKLGRVITMMIKAIL